MGNNDKMTEHRLQYEIIKWYRHEFKERNGSLWANFSEQNKFQAGQKKALGMVRALPDLMMVVDGCLIGIELKLPGTRHDVQHLREQAEWLLTYPRKGWFCDSLEMAQKLISCRGLAIDPLKVMNVVNKCGTKTIQWKTELFL